MATIKDLTGKTFGPFTVMSVDSKDKNGNYKWKVVCDFGHESIITVGHLKRVKKCCKCSFPDLTGQKNGSLRILGPANSPRGNAIGVEKWHVLCETCGVESKMRTYDFHRNKICWRCMNFGRIEPGLAAFRRLYNMYKTYARRRRNGRNFDLSEEEFKSIVQSNCCYCGEKPSRSVMSGSKGHDFNGDFLYSGIDRVDNRLGYVSGNVKPACSICNLMRGTLSVEDFLDQVGRIHAFCKYGDCHHIEQRLVNTFDCDDGKFAVNDVWRKYFYAAKKRNIRFSLSREDIARLIGEDCNYCGSPPSRFVKINDRITNYLHNGIDRTVSDKTVGYVMANCVPCCKVCNFMKKRLTLDEFLSHIDTIYKYNTKTNVKEIEYVH